MVIVSIISFSFLCALRVADHGHLTQMRGTDTGTTYLSTILTDRIDRVSGKWQIGHTLAWDTGRREGHVTRQWPVLFDDSATVTRNDEMGLRVLPRCFDMRRYHCFLLSPVGPEFAQHTPTQEAVINHVLPTL